MRVKIGSVVIPDATVERFIDMESGLPLSMIRVTYFGIRSWDRQIVEAFHREAALPFESEILSTFVLSMGFVEDRKEEKHEYILRERADHVSSGYKIVAYDEGEKKQRIVFVVPEDLNIGIGINELSKLPHERLILRKDIPKIWLRK